MGREFELLVQRVYGAWRKKRRGFIEPCPDEESLALLSQGLIAREEAGALHAHIVRCPLCAEYLAASIRVSACAQESVPAHLLVRLKERSVRPVFAMDVVLRIIGSAVSVLRTTGEILNPRDTSLACAYRGKKRPLQKEITIREDFRSLQVELTIRNKGKESFALAVCAWTKGRVFKGIRYTLVKDGIELESYRTDDGKAVFENVSNGLYTIYLANAGKDVSTISLDVKR